MGRIYKALLVSNNGTEVNIVAFVDSDSDKTIISQRIADLLHLERLAKEPLEVANGEIIDSDIAYISVRSPIDNITCVMNVNITDIPFKRDADENIDMIVGVDFLQKNNVKLIFEEKEVY